jgi:hypothetical protein
VPEREPTLYRIDFQETSTTSPGKKEWLFALLSTGKTHPNVAMKARLFQAGPRSVLGFSAKIIAKAALKR